MVQSSESSDRGGRRSYDGRKFSPKDGDVSFLCFAGGFSGSPRACEVVLVEIFTGKRECNLANGVKLFLYRIENIFWELHKPRAGLLLLLVLLIVLKFRCRSP